MLKWLVTLAVVLFVLGIAGPWLAKMVFGRLPVNFSVELIGRSFYFPVATSILLSLALMLILRVVRI